MIDDNNFVSHKSTPNIEKAVKNIQALNEDTAQHNNSQVVFLDPDYSNYNQEAIKAIEYERERIQKEQANLISIIPAPKHNTDTNKNTLITETNPQHKNNTQTENQQSIQDTQRTNIHDKNTAKNELQLERAADLKNQHSGTNSTTSQDYHTPPLSPGNDEISEPNREELQELNETL